jgi:prepilin-type N-terminal cleavage/methylation domain-containing protein/prepilin-type processing-associated H-X9-DG protein
MRQRSTNAFTLVELLVVIAIIGMLMALLTNAVQAARESGRRIQCSKNIGELAKASQQYENAMKSFPGFRNGLTVQNNLSNNAPALLMVSWVGMITPYLDRSDIYNFFKTTPAPPTGATTPPNWQKLLRVTICPSDPPDSTAPSTGACSYTANGLVFRDPIGCMTTTGSGAAFAYVSVSGVVTAPTADPACTSVKSIPSRSLEYISSNDGLYMTLMISENRRVDPTDTSGGNSRQHNWWDCDMDTGTPSTFVKVTFGTKYVGNLDGVYAYYCNSTNGKTAGSGYPTAMNDNVQSNHSGGVVAAFCDGHVGFFRTDIGGNPASGVGATDPGGRTIYGALVTPDGILMRYTSGDPTTVEPALDESSIP